MKKFTIQEAIAFRTKHYSAVVPHHYTITLIDEACAFVALGYVVTDTSEIAENWAPKESWTENQWQLFAAEMSAIANEI